MVRYDKHWLLIIFGAITGVIAYGLFVMMSLHTMFVTSAGPGALQPYAVDIALVVLKMSIPLLTAWAGGFVGRALTKSKRASALGVKKI